MNQPIRLRAIEPEDLDLLYRIENDDCLWNVGVTNVPYSRYTLHNYVANCSDDIYADRQVRLVVETDGQAVGLVDLVNFSPAHQRAELGIVIEQPHRRQGVAMAALREMERYARQVLHLHQLYAIIDVRNEASLSLFRRLGYQESAHLNDWLYDGREYHDAVVMQTFL